MKGSESDVEKLLRMLAADPMLFPFEWDRRTGMIEFVGLREEEYEQASFLDERALGPTTVRGVVPFELVQALELSTKKPCNFIFHVSHCGSTLLSRLLGLHAGVFSLREPRVLRTFYSQKPFDIHWLFGLLSRTFRADQMALIKATSYCNAFASDWLACLGESKAVLLTIPLRPFLASVLDGALVDIQSHKDERWQRLKALQVVEGQQIETLSTGQLAAMSWLCEMLTLEAVAERFEDRCLRVRFDMLLKEPSAMLDSIALFLGLAAPLPLWAQHPIWDQYAKRPGVFYNSEMRSLLLVQAERAFEEETNEGVRWIESLDHPRVSKLLLRLQAEG